MTYRTAANLILEDRLLNSDLEYICKWVEKANENAYESLRDYDKEIEVALLTKREPLIELTIANFGTSEAALTTIWSNTEVASDKNSGHIRALRLAILSNQNIGKFFGPNLVSIIGENKFPVFLKQASNEELGAMGQNPKHLFFESLYERKGAFESLTEDRWREVVNSTIGNPRLEEKYDDSNDFDGYGSYKHSCVNKAIYALPAIVPVTQEWAHTLSYLLAKTKPDLPFNYDLDTVEATIKRWQVDLFPREPESSFNIDPCSTLRTYYSQLLFNYRINKPVEKILADQDQAVRCAAYVWGQLSPEQIYSGAQQDKSEFADWICNNKNLCKSESLRESVRTALREFGNEEGWELDRFTRICEEQFKLHPKWFKDDELELYVEEPTEPTVNTKIVKLQISINKMSEQINTIHFLLIAAFIYLVVKQFFS